VKVAALGCNADESDAEEVVVPVVEKATETERAEAPGLVESAEHAVSAVAATSAVMMDGVWARMMRLLEG
jgi:hypothetical protein